MTGNRSRPSKPRLALIVVLAAAAAGAAAAWTSETAGTGVGEAAGTAGASLAAPAGPEGEGWQQEVSYAIEASLDEEAEALRAAAIVGYRNASPDTLRHLYFHLYLNAFRPGSIWARNERRERFDFGALEEPEYGYERLREVRILPEPGSGAERADAVAPPVLYPHAPDSTVVRIDLPAPLPPGGELRVRLAWEARPATLCRRQCREGRSWDFAQWYPRIAVYDRHGWNDHPLYPQGEFYGEFGTYDVTLELAEDQVVGATGVPVEGDPGWEVEPGSPLSEIRYRRGFYGDVGKRPVVGLLGRSPPEGRRRVRFRAERVHHFAWSVSPDYRYETGRHGETAIHVLSRPGDEEWEGGTAVGRTVEALEYLEEIYGSYPYPQLTNLHRLEGGGTEFPMVIMDGSASLGLIVHEAGHQYAHGILANNEWREAWLDEGLTTYVHTAFFERRGRSDLWARNMEGLARFERDGGAQPVATLAHYFRDYSTYATMSYTKPAVVLYMLRELVGADVFGRILRSYYERHRFSHVSEGDLRRVAEEESGRELDWFFDQWLHTTRTLDYALGHVETRRREGGGWRTRVEVIRLGDAWMPVTLRVGGTTRRLDSRLRRFTAEVTTSQRPGSVALDPQHVLFDVDRTNDGRELR